MKKVIKFISLILILMFTILLTNIGEVSAALQSNKNTPSSKSTYNWLREIRNMQALGGTLGREDNIDTTTLRSETTDLDIHMEKNTEYGAMAILSASAYGNLNKITKGETTTGNQTGIVMNGEECVSGGTASVYNHWGNVSNRYKNVYGEFKVGDALRETNGWHGGITRWYDHNGLAAMRRMNGSIFGYMCAKVSSIDSDETNNSYQSRAAIVVGEGI